MKHLLFLIGVMVSSLLICSESLCNAQQDTQPVGSRLELSANKEVFVLLEPIILTFKVTGIPDQPFPGQSLANPRYGRLYAVASSEHGVEEIPGFSLDPNSSILTAGVEPGRTQELQLMFVPSERKLLMMAGTYQIRARLEMKPKITAESEPITIEIRKPSGLELEASRYMRSKGLPYYFFGSTLTMPDGRPQSEVWAEAITNLDEFVRLYGETPYGDYATRTLGLFYFHQEQYGLAISMLVRLVGKDEFARLDSVLYTLAAAYMKLGDHAKAKEYMELLKVKYPHSDYLKSTVKFIR